MFLNSATIVFALIFIVLFIYLFNYLFIFWCCLLFMKLQQNDQRMMIGSLWKASVCWINLISSVILNRMASMPIAIDVSLFLCIILLWLIKVLCGEWRISWWHWGKFNFYLTDNIGNIFIYCRILVLSIGA